MSVSSVNEHWIKQDALTINLNHFGDPDYLQVSVLAGAVVMAFKQDVIGYNAAHNYRTWPLEAANTYLETSSAYNVYARLTRSEVNARALVIYDPILRDIEGREITYEKNEETGEEKEILGESNENFYFIFLGQISSSISPDGRSILREWTSEYRSGSLETNEQQNDWMAILNKMFRPHYDDPLNPDTLTWIEAKAHMGIAGGLTSFIDNGTLNLPSIYDGLPIDGQTLRWKEVTNEDGSITRVLESVGGGTGEGNGTISSIAINGTGNAITSVVLSEDKTRLTFIKGMNFITSDYLQEYYWNKTEISNNYYNKFYIEEKFFTREGASGLFVTLDDTPQDIDGEKNFIGSLKVNGNPIVYNSEEGYWILDGDLLVTGDITSFANEDGYTPSSIMDALRVDETNLKVIDGVLTFVGSTGGSGGVSEKVTWANIEGKPTWIGESKPSYSWSEITGKPNFVTEEYLDEEGFLTAMDIQVLTFTSGTFNAVSYDPSIAPKTVNIPTKLSHLEDDSDFVTLGMIGSYATKTWVGQQGFLYSSDLNGYATEKWVGQQGFATEDWVDENYFSINGGQLHGDLWLRSGTESYGRRIIFGDVRTSNGQPYVYIGEDTDDDLTIASWGDFRIKVGDGAYLTYIKDDGYWEITGDLLVTGGITSYE